MFRGENQWRDIMQVIMRFQGFEPRIRRLMRREIVTEWGTFFRFAEEMVENTEDLLVFRATSVSSFLLFNAEPRTPFKLVDLSISWEEFGQGQCQKV